LARQLGLGVILAEGSPPEYVAEVRRILGPTARITVFVWSNLDPQNERGLEVLRPTVRQALHKSYLSAQLGTLHRSPTCELDLVQRLTVAGDVHSCRDAIARLAASGADSIVLQPIHGAEEQQIDAFAHAGLLSGQQTPTAPHPAAMRHAAEVR
jgi:hypothetical protein